MKKKARTMTKKGKDGYKIMITEGEPPFQYDAFNKELMEKLEYANKYGCAEICDDEEDSPPKQ